MAESTTDHDILISMRSENRLEFANMKNEMKEIKTTVNRIGDDHENRIRTLEAAKWKIIGIAMAFSAGITIAGVIAAYLALKR